MSWTAQKINNLFFNPPSHPVVGSFRAHNFQKSRKFHELPRKWFHFKPPTPTHPGWAVLGDTRRGREEEGRSKGLEGRKVGGGRREERRRGGGREEGRHEGGLR